MPCVDALATGSSAATTLAEVEAGVATSADLLIGMLGTGRRLALGDLQAMSALGAQRARQGVPLAGVLASVSAGIARGWQLFADEASALDFDGDRVVVLDAVDPWFSDALAVASEAMVRGYLDAQGRPPGAPPAARASMRLQRLGGGATFWMRSSAPCSRTRRRPSVGTG